MSLFTDWIPFKVEYTLKKCMVIFNRWVQNQPKCLGLNKHRKCSYLTQLIALSLFDLLTGKKIIQHFLILLLLFIIRPISDWFVVSENCMTTCRDKSQTNRLRNINAVKLCSPSTYYTKEGSALQFIQVCCVQVF